MSAATNIEWCDSTFNPWEGCQKVGPGCDNCYAEARNARYGGGVAVNWGPGAPRRRTSAANWRKPVQWQREAASFMAENGHRRRVFCASLADVFDNEVPAQWRIELLKLILATPDLDWLLLTKRIGNAADMLERAFRAAHAGREGWADNLPANVWIGATVVDQAEANRDIPKLLATPAAVRFLSIEPMLGPISIERATDQADEGTIDWVIAGGESGPAARPVHPDWLRALRDECEAFGTPFLFKQWGEWTPGENVERQRGTVDTAFLYDDGWHIYPLNLTTDHGHIDDQPDLYRVGKKAAGRLLDGIEHNGYPGAA